MLVPIQITHADDGSAEVDRESFQTLVNIVRAIRATDEVMADVIDPLRRRGGGNGGNGEIPGLIRDMPQGTAATFIERLQFDLVEHTSASWEFWFGLLEQYVAAEHGHARVPDAYRTPDGDQLGVWVSTQRQKYASGDLSPERITRLEAVDGWVWEGS